VHRAEKWTPVFGKKLCSIKHVALELAAEGEPIDKGWTYEVLSRRGYRLSDL
jgi:hypothetical protein